MVFVLYCAGHFKDMTLKILGAHLRTPGPDKHAYNHLYVLSSSTVLPAGILTNNRVRLLFDKNMKTYRPRRKGERKRKSVRGCIVDSNLSVLNLVIVKKGEQVWFSSPTAIVGEI